MYLCTKPTAAAAATAPNTCSHPCWHLQLLVANVGDSRCFVGSLNGQGGVESYALSTDHNPDVVSEAQRIMAHKVSPTGLRQAWHHNQPASSLEAAPTPGHHLCACNQSAAEHACGSIHHLLGAGSTDLSWFQTSIRGTQLWCCMPVLEEQVSEPLRHSLRSL